MHRRLKTEVRRNQIIEVARHMLATHGIDTLTTKALAAEVGVTEGALYRHFRSKRDILLGIIDEIEFRLQKRVEMQEQESVPALEALQKLLYDHLSRAERQRGVTFIVIAEVMLNGDTHMRECMQAIIDKHLAIIEQMLRKGIEQGRIDPQINVSAAAVAFFGMVQAAHTLRRFATEESPLAGGNEALWQVFLNGIILKDYPGPMAPETVRIDPE